ncbi:MAG TPA: alginate lyase family protein [Candidatus Acidoferrales bacterium]|nr:alginate lyase family protein [Candidatus Acidoferrales bacterium]
MRILLASLCSLLTGLLIALAPATAQKPAPLSNQAPCVFILDGVALKNLRARIASGSAREPSLDRLRADADAAMKEPLLSVTEKDRNPPSGDKHDYMSLAPYWWPNPSKPGGLPYIRRDGETNPEIQRVPDHKNFDRLMSDAHTLALAFYLFREERYAARAAELLRHWFLDPSSRMNPNLQFAQAVLGHNEGRGTGLIETRAIGTVADAAGLLASSEAWTAGDQSALVDWCSHFLKWMLESNNGKDEAAAKNNHGTYYDVQIVALAVFTGNRDLAERVLREVPAKRIATQIEPDGSQPLEIARTKSLSYSAFNLAAFFELARLGDNVGVDLWDFQSKDGRSIRNALDFLVPFVAGEKQWTSPQIEKYNAAEIIPVLLAASDRYKSPAYREASRKADPSAPQSLAALLIAEKHAD